MGGASPQFEHNADELRAHRADVSVSQLVGSSYVVVLEIVSLAQARLGVSASCRDLPSIRTSGHKASAC